MLNWTPEFSADRGVGNLLSVIDSVSQVGYGVAIWATMQHGRDLVRGQLRCQSTCGPR